MKYIAFRHYKGRGYDGSYLDIPVGTELTREGMFLYTYDKRCICVPRSEIGRQHFAWNDDGYGKKRGEITYSIAYRDICNSESNFRFSEAECELLCSKYSKFLKPADQIVFNDYFYDADVDDLQELLDDLNSIK